MSAIDNLWLMVGGMLVFFMHSGFALLEVGSVSVRNTQVSGDHLCKHWLRMHAAIARMLAVHLDLTAATPATEHPL